MMSSPATPSVARLRLARAVAIFASSAVLAVTPAASAFAHTPTNFYYPSTWTSSTGGTPVVGVLSTKSMSQAPSGLSARTVDGFEEWEALGPIDFSVNTNPTSPDFSPVLHPSPCITSSGDARTSTVHWRDTNEAPETRGFAAYVLRCVSTTTGRLIGSHFVWGSQYQWYTGTNTRGCNAHVALGVEAPFCVTQSFDAWSVATHEAAHFAGFFPAASAARGTELYHWDRNGGLCEETEQAFHSLCPVVVPFESYPRSPNAHDIHVFQAAYPR